MTQQVITTATQLWASRKERFVIPQFIDEETEGGELTEVSPGNQAGRGQNQDPNSGLWVSYLRCVLLTILPPPLPSRWFLGLFPFPLGLLHAESDWYPNSEHPSLYQEKILYYEYWLSSGKSSNHHIKNSRWQFAESQSYTRIHWCWWFMKK